MNLVTGKYERKEMCQKSGLKSCMVLGLEFIYKEV